MGDYMKRSLELNELGDAKKFGDLVYDVGMHKGEDAEYYLKKGFRVVGFEADPDLAAHCRIRFKPELESGRLVIIEGAIVEVNPEGDGSRKAGFFKNRDVTVWGTVARDWASRNETLGASSDVIEVDAIDFSECLKSYGVPYYLKVDIEGMDTVCLRALLKFDQKPDYVSIESEKVSFGRLSEEIELFQQLGYDCFKAVQQEGISRQREPNPSGEGVYVGHKFSEGSSGLFGSDLSGEWRSSEAVLAQYRLIFLLYGLFGDHGSLRESFLGKVLRRMIRLMLRRPVPGWYDTHARHASVSSMGNRVIGRVPSGI
jgi:FkbM family methyltransferase